MRTTPEQHVVIIGAGFCGIALANQLVGRAQVTLVEEDSPATGPAYRSRDEALKLNAPADRMSVDPETPLDFVHFLERRRAPWTGFVPRAWYADYLEERLEQLLARGVRLLRTSATDVTPGFDVQLASGQSLRADHVVLATGNALPRRPEMLPVDDRVIQNPWDDDAIARIPREARVLLLGTGLTALDVALLLARRGHEGEVLALSKIGRAHV
jgi:uncharacterized NAD(P)/FAD-binding protein YdhS